MAVVTEALDRVPALRKAHAVYMRFHRTGRPIPLQVRLLNARYREQFREPRPEPLRRVRPPTGSSLVAAAIQQGREGAGMSRRDLAAALGVTAAAVRLWEGAARTPGPESWVQLELTLGPLGVVREADQEQQRGEADAA